MFRHRTRLPALILLAGLITTLTVFLGERPLPSSSSAAAPALDGPSVVTDALGRFRFDGLHHASHVLRLDPSSLPPEIHPAANDMVLTLSPGVTRSLPVAPGLTLRATYHDDGATLDGALFHDQNGDGVQASDEAGLAGARVIDPDVYQYFVPFNDGNLYTSFSDVLGAACLNDPNVSNTIASTISLTPSANGTTIYYDQWEDGYDADPTVPGPTTQVLTVNAGQVQTWRNNVPIPRNPANQLYDGRDRITVVGQPVTGVRAAWLTQPGTRLAGAWEMPKVSDWGKYYVIPVGENLGQRNPNPALRFGDYDYVSASVMAAYDNTVVQIDANADGVYETTQTINAGQTIYVRGSANQQGFAIVSGAQVNATLPVQVQVRAGNCRAPYSGRSYTLVPAEKWSNDYWSPVSSFFTGANGCVVNYLPPQNGRGLSADVDIYIFNPNAAPLNVNYEDASGAGTLTIPARSTGSYLNLHPKPLTRSNTQGVHLSAASSFWAVTAVDSTSLGNNGADFDWSYSLIPAKDLSGRVVLSWAPGSSATPPAPLQNISGSTVYVQATTDGTIVRADLNSDGVPDTFDTDGNGTLSAVSAYGYNELTSNAGIVLNRGQMLRISDPVDHDMTGASINSQDYNHPLAAVYGEDACIAGPRDPFLDLGYTVLPLPQPEFSKNSRLLIDADRSGDISPGDTLEYKVQATNNGTGPIINPIIIDTLPFTYTDFILGSLTSSPAPNPPGITYDNGSGTYSYVPTGAAGTPDPNIHAIKANYPNLTPGNTILMTLQIKLQDQIPANVLSVVNNASLTSDNTPPITSKVTNPINQVDLLIHKTDHRTLVSPRDQLTYTLTYTNAGPGIAHSVVMTDTLPPSAYNISTPTVPGVITPTVDLALGKVYFKLGTLLPGQVGSTTISLRLADNTVGPVVNTVDIDTTSSEINKNNNRSVDIDQVQPADLLIHKTDGTDAVSRTATLTYTLTYTNAGPGVAFNSILTDTLPPTAINARTPSVPGVITPTIELGRVILRLGILQPGQVGKTTVTVDLGPNTPTNQNIVNTVEIRSTTPDPNPGNNISRDIDKVPGPTAVVLSEFRAERGPGGVLVLWRTLAEQDNYGFRVYRGRTPSRANAELITPQIIPGQGRGRADGASYSFFDASAPEGALYYWIEDIDMDGVSEFHGPAQPALQSVRSQIFIPFVAARR